MNEMRRSRQQLGWDACRAVLERGSACVLALAGHEGTDDFPYAVPLSYVYLPVADGTGLGSVFFHCAQAGTKLAALAADDRVSLCVVDQDRVVSEKYTTLFRSVVGFGRARAVPDDAGRRAALVALAEKYAPERTYEQHMQEIRASFDRTCVVEVVLEQVTGKEARELAQERLDEEAEQ